MDNSDRETLSVPAGDQRAENAEPKRREFEMSPDDLKALLEACRSVPMIALQCGPVSSPQENANRAWCALGDRMGFDGMSVEPSPKGQRFFTAISKATGAPS